VSVSSGAVKARAALAFLGGLPFVALALLASLYLGVLATLFFKNFSLSTFFFMLVTTGTIALCGLAYHRCFRTRRFLNGFGSWLEHSEVEEGPQERRALLASARAAFLEGNYSLASRKMATYLEARPSDNVARSNYARALAMDCRVEEAKEQLDIGGDPHKQKAWLNEDASWRRWFLKPRKAFDSAEAQQIVNGTTFYIISAAGLGLGGMILLLLCYIFVVSADSFSMLRAEKNPMQAAARLLGNYGGTAFQALESENFVFYYHNEAFMQRVRKSAQDALDFDLKFYNLPETQFASKKIKIYICDSQKEFLSRSPLNKAWEAGVTLDDYQEIYLFRPAPGAGEWPYFENTLAHEISHVCYRNILPTIGQDSWLNEGLASYLGWQFSLERLNFPVSAWLKDKVFKGVTEHPLSFEEFSQGNPQSYKDVARITQFYNQGFSMVFVLIHYYGKDSFLSFLRDYSHSKDIDRSLNATYPTIHNMSDLQGIWYLFIK
jgi:hypothetical protein